MRTYPPERPRSSGDVVQATSGMEVAMGHCPRRRVS